MSSTRDQEIAFAKKTKWYRLGPLETTIQIQLTDEERMKLGKDQSDALMQIEALEEERKKFSDEIKGKVKVHKATLYETAEAISRGYREEVRLVPCFVDTKTKERVFVDLKTGEEVDRGPMQQGDEQAVI